MAIFFAINLKNHTENVNSGCSLQAVAVIAPSTFLLPNAKVKKKTFFDKTMQIKAEPVGGMPVICRRIEATNRVSDRRTFSRHHQWGAHTVLQHGKMAMMNGRGNRRSALQMDLVLRIV